MKKYKKIYAIRTHQDRNFWTNIGIAAVNQDGSMNLIFNLFPNDPNITIQVREWEEREPGSGG